MRDRDKDMRIILSVYLSDKLRWLAVQILFIISQSCLTA